ncbi:MAG: hypothetical protein ACXAEF_13615, partial [Candidatus Thorarchaeota archaeon]
MMSDEMILNEALFDILGKATDLAGVPCAVVKREMFDYITQNNLSHSEEDVKRVINKALNDWTINKTIDELSYARLREYGLPEESGFTWHLKIMTPEETEEYRSLRPEEQALIKLLRMQNELTNLGRMPKKEAIEILTELGFSNHLEHLGKEDIIEEFGTFIKGVNVWCYGLVQEWYKTDEYKQMQEEADQRYAEKEYRRMRSLDDSEVTQYLFGRLEELSVIEEEELFQLSRKKNEMTEEEWKQEKRSIEERNEQEENILNSFIEKVYSLSYDDLLELQKVFNGKLPPLSEVQKFFEKKGL